MEFSQIIKQLRADHQLTQQQLADELHVSRQAVSNWENEKNLPDIEMLMTISKKYQISLDELIMNENGNEEIKKKLIEDGSENKRAKINLYTCIIGFASILLGVIFLFIKAVSVEYIDSEGFLHENFFLLPISALFIFGGLLILIIAGVVSVIHHFRKRK